MTKLKNILFYLAFIILLFSCNQKNVKVPINNIKGIQDTIYDNSKIWIFFQQKNSDTIAELNSNNKLANTHLIFNIDRRLQLKHLKDILNKIQLKKEKPSMHSNGKYMHSYLSYIDTSANKLSMVLFDSIKFFPLKEMETDKNQLLLNYSNSSVQLNKKDIDFKDLINKLQKYKDSSKRTLNIVLNKNVTYNNYILLKASLQQFKLDAVFVNKNEFVY